MSAVEDARSLTTWQQRYIERVDAALSKTTERLEDKIDSLAEGATRLHVEVAKALAVIGEQERRCRALEEHYEVSRQALARADALTPRTEALEAWSRDAAIQVSELKESAARQGGGWAISRAIVAAIGVGVGIAISFAALLVAYYKG